MVKIRYHSFCRRNYGSRDEESVNHLLTNRQTDRQMLFGLSMHMGLPKKMNKGFPQIQDRN
jgi:hypothetical protein